MPIKEILYQQPIQLYIIELLSIIYFIFQLVLSHITHSLTLQFASYHMICKIIALTGRVLTIKYSKKVNQVTASSENGHTSSTIVSTSGSIIPNGTTKSEHLNGDTINDNNLNGKINVNKEENKFIKDSKILPATQKEREDQENKLKNTFGWTRVNVLTMLVICIVLASLSFSNVIEAIQVLVHMNHKDSTHYPLPLLTCGAIGLFLNGLCYFLIGGYTIHLITFCKFKNNTKNNSFICCDDTGKIKNNKNLEDGKVLETISSSTSNVQKTIENFKSENFNGEMKNSQLYPVDDLILEYDKKREGWFEVISDVSSSIFVMICGLSVHLFDNYSNSEYGKYIDPILAILSSIFLLMMMFSYMKESCMILLQTIPGTINIQVFRKNLLERFEEITVHDLHIWSLTSKKNVSTVHIIFRDTNIYLNTIQEIKKYFHEQGITTVTIQPEFLCSEIRPIHSTTAVTLQELPPSSNAITTTTSYSRKNHLNETTLCNDCLVPCLATECAEKSCCNTSGDLKEIISESSTTLSSSSSSNKQNNSACCQQTNTLKTITNGNLNSSNCNSVATSSSLTALPPIKVKQLQTLNVNNLKNKLNTSHIIKFNNKNNQNLEIKTEQLNGNYKKIESNKYNNNNNDNSSVQSNGNCNSKNFPTEFINDLNQNSTIQFNCTESNASKS